MSITSWHPPAGFWKNVAAQFLHFRTPSIPSSAIRILIRYLFATPPPHKAALLRALLQRHPEMDLRSSNHPLSAPLDTYETELGGG